MGGTVIDRLVSVKSIVTLTLTGVFSYLAIVGKVDGKEFLTIFTVVIGFYFGTQAEKRDREAASAEQQEGGKHRGNGER